MHCLERAMTKCQRGFLIIILLFVFRVDGIVFLLEHSREVLVYGNIWYVSLLLLLGNIFFNISGLRIGHIDLTLLASNCGTSCTKVPHL